MRRNVTKIATVIAMTLIVAGSSSSIAYAHHGCSRKVAVKSPAVCYEDGSCDVDGVCILGVDCDGTAHHTDADCYSESRRHRRHHR
ncbi:MAG: hypothetical protein NC433_12290 [Clostridiales bacterium]|nr:hypothetical protein [Clostridiales bacterium]